MLVTLSKKLFDKLRRKGYRDAYVAEGVRTGVAYQIRALREERGLSQKAFAEQLQKPASVVSRLEDPDYGKFTVQTLLEIASSLDVALIVKFVSFPEFLRRTRDVGPEALAAESFDESQFAEVAPSAALTQTSRSARSIILHEEDPALSYPIAFVSSTVRATSTLVH